MTTSITDRIWVGELILICSTALTTWLLSCTSSVREIMLNLLFKIILYIFDLTIFFSALMIFKFKQGLPVLYLARLLPLVFGEDYQVSAHMLWTVGVYGGYKLVTLALVKMAKIKILDSRNREARESNKPAEEKRRNFALIVLTVVLHLALAYFLSQNHGYGGSIIFGLNFGLGIACIYMVKQAEDYVFRIACNFQSISFYIYLAQCFILPKLFSSCWFIFTTSTFLHLTLTVMLLRIYIGSRSNKFSKTDEEMFDLVYIFSGDEGHRFYRSIGNEERIMRVLDRMSRLISTILYYLGFYLAVAEQKYVYFLVGMILMGIYTEDGSTSLNFLEKYFSQAGVHLRFRVNLLLPLLLLWYLLSFHSSPCSKTAVYNLMNNCNRSNSLTLWTSIFLSTTIISAQVLAPTTRTKLYELLQKIIPIYIGYFIFSLQCQTFKLFLMGIYTIGLCFSVIRDERLTQRKGGKRA